MATKQSDGRYRAKVTVGHGTDGKSIVKYVSGRTKKELEAAKEEARKRHLGGISINREVLAAPYFQEWYDAYKRPRLAPKTNEGYVSRINNYILPAIGDKQMRAVTALDLQQILNRMDGMGQTSISDVLTLLKGAFTRAYADGVIDRNPATALIKPSCTVHRRRMLTDAETAAALHVARTHPKGILISILYYTGMRIGEVLGLQWQDINFKDNTITVQRDLDFTTRQFGALKTSCSYRQIPLFTPLRTALWPIRGVGTALVVPGRFGGPITKPGYIMRWERLMREMWLHDTSIDSRDDDGMRRSVLTAHYFRHNFASILYNAGVDVLSAQRWLGHADAATTLRIYSHLSDKTVLSDMEKAEEIFTKLP